MAIVAACGPHHRANGIIEAKSVAECRPGVRCDSHDAWLCEYPGGSCSCGRPEYCGGTPPPAEYESQPDTWQCSPYPPEVRDDGCPGRLPSGDCSEPGQKCTYDVSCCNQTAVCTEGAWVAGPMTDCPL